MKKFLSTILATFLGISLFCVTLVGLGIYGIQALMSDQVSKEQLPEKFLIEIDLNQFNLQPFHLASRVEALFGSDVVSFDHLNFSLMSAAKDPRVEGLIVRWSFHELDFAQIEQLRRTIEIFQKNKKFTLFFTTDFNTSTTGMMDYFLATAFDKICLQPSGTLGLVGFSIETPFFKPIMDKHGIQAQFVQKHEYKGGPEPFLQESFSTPVKDSMIAILDDWMKVVLSGAETKLGKETLTAINEKNMPMLSHQAFDLKLVDEIGYYEDIVRQHVEKNDFSGKAVSVSDYVQDKNNTSILDKTKEKLKIATVFIEGEIVDQGDVFQEGISPAPTISDAIREAAHDEQIDAILIRVNSPGGSYTASDTIWQSIQIAKDKKPVVVSMSGYAASGGYFVAAAADKIIAEQGTITGSIGIYGGKFSVSGLFNDLGIRWQSINIGKNADMSSFVYPFSDEQMEKLNTFLDHAYQDFIGKVASGRNMSVADVDKVARGRVWTGYQAKKLGLVDQIGGIETAIETIRDLLPTDHIKKAAEAELVVMPELPSEWEILSAILSDLGQSSPNLNLRSLLGGTNVFDLLYQYNQQNRMMMKLPSMDPRGMEGSINSRN